jgi:hypothetical protein
MNRVVSIHFLEEEDMWLWECELRQLGFRRRSDGYWRCERRYGLPAEAYLSLFASGEHHLTADRARSRRRIVEFSAFHVTMPLVVDRIHFYYHERSETAWEPGGYTSSVEIARHGADPLQLRAEADRIAGRVLERMNRTVLPRCV